MNNKKLFLSLVLFVVSLFAYAQHFENNYLSIDIPNGWEIDKQDVPAIDAEIVVFLNTGGDIYNVGMVMGMDKYMDAQSTIDYEPFVKTITAMFQDVKISESRKSNFLGRSAYTKDFEALLNGNKFRGALYTIEIGYSSIIIIGAYKVGCKSNLPAIWRSITWKEHDSNARKFSNMREELESLVEVMNQSLQTNTVVNDGVKFISLRLEDNADCVIFKYQLVDVDGSAIDESALMPIMESVKKEMLNNLHTMSSQILVFKRLMDAQYIFKAEYVDKNNNPLYTVKIVPDDYK